MTDRQPRNVLYFAENALSAIQGGGIVAYAVLRGLPAERLLGFFEYRNITPAPEFAERFHYLGTWRTPALFRGVNRLFRGWTSNPLRTLFPDRAIALDLAFVKERVQADAFRPEAVYFAGLSYRYLRLAVMAAEHYDVPMVLLHMDDWIEVERRSAGWWGNWWHRRIVQQMTRAAARSLASTTNSPRLAARVSAMTGYRHIAANNCCSDLYERAASMDAAPDAGRARGHRIPVIVYAGAMNRHLQGETLRVLASAITELNAEGVRVHLHIYTPWEFAPEANAIAVPRAVYYKGQIGREALAEAYAKADFLATTVTYRESHVALFRHSLSTKLSEYLCAGKPVISMGHPDWHLHEYVQDQGCGFSILMDENFSRARIKEQLRAILSTDAAALAAIGRRNRQLWARAHDVALMAAATRRALGLTTGTTSSHRASAGPGDEPLGSGTARGVLWIGGPGAGADDGWVPTPKLTAIARRLVDVFNHTTVDIICGSEQGPTGHPGLERILEYCQSIGLVPTLCFDAHAIDVARLAELPRTEPFGVLLTVESPDGRSPAILRSAADALSAAGIYASVLPLVAAAMGGHLQIAARQVSGPTYIPYGWEPAGARWSLADTQRRADMQLELPRDLFNQVEVLRQGIVGTASINVGERADASAPVPPDLATASSVAPVQRVINQLSVRLDPSPRRPVLWLYGSIDTGLEVIAAIEAHAWLGQAVEIGGFVSSPGLCKEKTTHGLAWRSVDAIAMRPCDLIVVTSEMSRLAIQEELSRHGWLDRMVPMFGLVSETHRYERLLADAEADAPAGEPDSANTPGDAGRRAVECAMHELIERCPASEIGDGLLAKAIDHAWTTVHSDIGPHDLPRIGSTRAA